MDFVFELLFEIILEGCIEAAGEKKVPLLLRILCAVILVGVYGGLVGFLVTVQQAYAFTADAVKKRIFSKHKSICEANFSWICARNYEGTE